MLRWSYTIVVMSKTSREIIDDALANLIFAGLTVDQISKIPKWLLVNIEKNKPALIKALEEARK